MFTLSYKGHHIHCYCDRDACHVQLMAKDGETVIYYNARSLHAAKCFISRRVNK